MHAYWAVKVIEVRVKENWNVYWPAGQLDFKIYSCLSPCTVCHSVHNLQVANKRIKLTTCFGTIKHLTETPLANVRLLYHCVISLDIKLGKNALRCWPQTKTVNNCNQGKKVTSNNTWLAYMKSTLHC